MGYIGKCKICGCTEDDPSFNPRVGFSKWTDEDHSLCNICADEKLRNHRLTVHRIVSKAKKAGVTVREIENLLMNGRPLLIKDDEIEHEEENKEEKKKKKFDATGKPQYQKGTKKPPRISPELEKDVQLLGDALQLVREKVLNCNYYGVSRSCDLPNETVRNIERGVGQIRNLLKYMKGLELDIKLSYTEQGLKVEVFRCGEKIFPSF